MAATIRVHFFRDVVNFGSYCHWCAEPTPSEWYDKGDDIMEIDRDTFARLVEPFAGNAAAATDLADACRAAGGRIVERT